MSYENTDATNNDSTGPDPLTFAMEQLGDGEGKPKIVDKLIGMGLTETAANNMVKIAESRMHQAVKTTGGSLGLGILGGLLAAIVGGVIWGWVAYLSGYEIGYLAVGIGVLCGFAVLYLAKKQTGLAFQIVAVLSSVLGILIGKYTIFYLFFNGMMVEELGADAPELMSYLSINTMQTFYALSGELMGYYDLLWLVLAVIAAWRITQDQD